MNKLNSNFEKERVNELEDRTEGISQVANSKKCEKWKRIWEIWKIEWDAEHQTQVKILAITREKAQIIYNDTSTRSIVHSSAIEIKARQ